MPYTPAVPTETNSVEEWPTRGTREQITLNDGSLMNIVFTDNRPMTPDERHSFVTNCEATMLERLRESITESNIPVTAMCFDGIIVRDTMAGQPSDEMQISDEDIELVMSQTNVPRSKAFTAIKDNENDIVKAIMELTM